MKTKLAALLLGVAMLGGAGIADAADLATRTDTQVMTLTDTQMNKVTAGHLYEPPTGLEPGMDGDPKKGHKGLHWIKVFGVRIMSNGWHVMCGQGKPNCK